MCNNSSDLTVQKCLQAYSFAISFHTCVPQCELHVEISHFLLQIFSYRFQSFTTHLSHSAVSILKSPLSFYICQHDWQTVSNWGQLIYVFENWMFLTVVQSILLWHAENTDWEAFLYSDQSVLQTALNLICKIIEALFLFILCPCRSCINLFLDGIWQLFDEILKQM